MRKMSDIKQIAAQIEVLAEDIRTYKHYKEELVGIQERLEKKEITEAEFSRELKGRSFNEWLAYYDSRIGHALSELGRHADALIESLSEGKQQKKTSKLGAAEKKKLLAELRIEEGYLRRMLPGKKEPIAPEYELYRANTYGRIANMFMEKYALLLTKKYTSFFDSLFHALQTSGIKMLSGTYVSVMLFSSMLAFIVSAVLTFLLSEGLMLFTLAKTLFVGLIAGVGTVAFLYIYPALVASSKKKSISNDLPFAVIHMSAVAGSGAQPIAMFMLLLSSGEYPGLESEVKRIVNYVNLFGYNLSTALRSVAITTPSESFRDLLNGMVGTIESGGSMSDFLAVKAEDMMTGYMLERRKFVETLSTYSDVYTGVGIAAPLLLFVTLAIIQRMGTDIMGISIRTLAWSGTLVVIPLLNIAFLVILNAIQPER